MSIQASVTFSDYRKFAISSYSDSRNVPDIGRDWVKMNVAPDTSNGFYAEAWQNTNTKDIVIAFRGTNDPLDLLTDAEIAFNPAQEFSQLTNARDFYQKVLQASGNPNANISLTGHSLGGGIAEYLAAEKGLKAVTFNAPGMRQLYGSASDLSGPLHPGFEEELALGKKYDITNYTVKGELISDALEHIGQSYANDLNYSLRTATTLGLKFYKAPSYFFQDLHNALMKKDANFTEEMFHRNPIDRIKGSVGQNAASRQVFARILDSAQTAFKYNDFYAVAAGGSRNLLGMPLESLTPEAKQLMANEFLGIKLAGYAKTYGYSQEELTDLAMQLHNQNGGIDLNGDGVNETTVVDPNNVSESEDILRRWSSDINGSVQNALTNGISTSGGATPQSYTLSREEYKETMQDAAASGLKTLPNTPAATQTNPLLNLSRVGAGVSNIPGPVYPPRPSSIQFSGMDQWFNYYYKVTTYDANGNVASVGPTRKTDMGKAQIYMENTKTQQEAWLKQAQGLYREYEEKVKAITGTTSSLNVPGAPDNNIKRWVYTPLAIPTIIPGLSTQYIDISRSTSASISTLSGFVSPTTPPPGVQAQGQFSTTILGQSVLTPTFNLNYPLMLDLDGDGIETLDVEQTNIYFDVEGTGFANHTGWTAPDDGLLAIDSNANGLIDDIDELFGGDEPGFDVLKTLDLNNDGIINSADSGFADLRVWQDINSNGVTNFQELKNLSQLNISSISLATQDIKLINNNNPIVEQSIFTRSDGSRGNISDVLFRYDKLQTISDDASYTISEDLMLLPQIRGTGLIKDLAVIASANTDFKTFLFQLSFQSDSSAIYNKMDDLLKYWAGLENVNPTQMRGPITEIKAVILSKFLNLDLTTIIDSAKPALEAAYDNIKDVFYLNFIAQTSIGQSLGLDYNFALDYIKVDKTKIYDTLIDNLGIKGNIFAALTATKILTAVGTITVPDLTSRIISKGYGDVLLDFVNGKAGYTSGTPAGDIMLSTAGADTLLGLAGHDFFINSGGNDVFNGATGNDSYTFERGDGADLINESAGLDNIFFGESIKLSDLQFVRPVNNGALSNDLQIRISGTNDSLTIVNWYANAGYQTENFIFQTPQSVNGGTAKTKLTISDIQSLVAIGYTNTATINGTTGNDSILNYSDATINANNGNDLIVNQGNSTIIGGNGNDTIQSSVGNDTFVFAAGFGTDTISDLGGSNTLDVSAITGNQTISVNDTSFTAGTGNTVSWNTGAISNLSTGSGNDTLTGNAGDNVLSGGTGNDSLTGGDGNDSYKFAGAFGVDTVNDASGNDTVDFSGVTSALTVNLTTTTVTQSTNSVTWSSGAIENAIGGSGADTITGTSGDNKLTGGGGNDTLTGGGGNDTYTFASGFATDSISDSAGNDTLDFSAFTTALNVNLTTTSTTPVAGTSVSWNAGAIENVVTGSGNDSLTGSSADNILAGGRGNDTLTGDAGNDTYRFAAGFGVDTVSDSAGTDTLDFGSLTGNMTVSLAATSYSDGAGNTVSWSGSNFENLTTGSGNDTLTGNTAGNVLAGGIGNDTYLGFSGTFGIDTIQDAAGSADVVNLSTLASTAATWTAQDTNSDGKLDQLTADFGSGNKLLVSNYFDNTASTVRGSGAGTGAVETLVFSDDAALTFAKVQGKISGAPTATGGNDSLAGTAGADTLDGLAGNDTLRGMLGNDTLIGNTGNDSLDGSDGDDTYQFAAAFGVDTIADASGADTLSFSPYTTGVTASLAGTSFTDGANTISWSASTLENLVGGSSHDALSGNTDGNVLNGGDGNDTLTGNGGNDTLNGGSGNDSFVFTAAFGADSIVDTSGTDQLNFSGYTSDLSISLAGTAVSDGLGNSVTWQQDTLENAASGSGNDVLTGNVSANLLSGNNGNDTLNGGAGNDTVDGGAGDDLYQFSAGFGSDSLVDASGIDTVDLSAFSNDLNVNLAGTSFTQSAGNTVAWAASTVENAIGGSGNDTLTGTTTSNVLTGGLGNDSLTADNGNDTLVGGLGNDTLNGGDGSDSYTGFTGTSGSDVVTDSSGSNDSASFAGLKTSQVAWSAVDSNSDGKVDQLKADLGGGTSVVIHNYFNNTTSSAGSSGQGTGLIESLIFDDDSSVTFGDVQGFINPVTPTSGNDNLKGTTGNDAINGLAGNDTIYGLAGNDSLTGGNGNDSLDGGDGDDRYIFAPGFGSDTVVDASGADRLDFSAYSTALNISLAAVTASDGSGNAVSWSANAIENLSTGAGNDTLTGSAGNNVLTGNDGNDLFVGSDGNDTLEGGLGTDSASYAGDGTVRYSTANTVARNGSLDTLNSIETVTAGSAKNDQFIAATNSAAVTVNLTTGSVSGNDGSVASVAGFEHVQGSAFNDSLTGNADSNLLEGLAGNDAISGADGDDFLYGTAGNDALDGGTGNDVLDGGADNDSLLGGLGDDSLTGGTGSDTLQGQLGNDGYLGFSNNTGADTVNDSGGTDYLTFTGVTTADAVWTAMDSDSNGLLDDLKIDFGSGNSVLVKNYFANDNADIGNTGTGDGFIESLKMDDASNLSVADVKQLLSVHSGNSGNDNVTGSEADDILSGGSGADSLEGYGGSDILLGGDGNDTLDAGNGDDLLSGDNGNDSLLGGDGDDIFAFGETFGSDTIVDTQGNNTISFSSPITGAASGGTTSDMTVNLATKTASSGANSVSWAGSVISNIAGGDGNDSLTGDGSANSIVDDLGNDTLVGGSGDDTLSGGVGNDTYRFASGFGNDLVFSETAGSDTFDFSAFTTALSINLGSTSFTQSSGNTITWDDGSIENLIGGSGNDTLTGNASDNSLSGNTGNDSLVGGNGNDSYRFASGFGTDTLNDAGGSDTIDFSAFTTALSINLGNTSFTQSTGNTVSWTAGAIENVAGGSGADSLTGNTADNLLAGNGGNDTLAGGSGNDTYVFASGFGTDSVTDSAGNDTLDFGAFTSGLSVSLAGSSFTQSTGNTVSWSGMENLTTGSGNDSLTGSTGDNILTGNSGNDTLNGGSGNDTYRFAAGFGTDIITDSAGTDTLDLSGFATGVAASLGSSSFTQGVGNTVSWSAGSLENLSTGSGNDTLIGSSGNNVLRGGLGDDVYAFAGSIGADTISDAAGSNTLDVSAYANTTVNLASNSFTASAGNTVGWSTGTIQNIISGSGNDALTGDGNNNRFDSGAGNDTMSGAGGNDTYILRDGFGTDSINDSAGNDTLDLSHIASGVGVDLSANTYIKDGNSLVWTADALDNLLLGSGNDNAAGNDNANLLTGQSGNDSLDGRAGNDTLVGGTGNDLLTGGDGDDLYKFSIGDGIDTVVDENGNDRLILGEGIKFENVGFTAVGENGNDMVIKFDLSNDQIVLKNQLSGNEDDGIDILEFADGSTMTRTDMLVNLHVLGKFDTPDYVETLTGSRHNENLFGIGGPDLMYGMGGEDVLHGGYGADTLYGGEAGDKLFGDEDDDTLAGEAGEDTLWGGAGNDSLVGGADVDEYDFDANWGNDVISDNQGANILNLTSMADNFNVNLAAGSGNEVTLGTNTINWSTGDIRTVMTGSGADSLLGSSGHEVLDSGDGNDTLNGANGNDLLVGGDGNDLYTGFTTSSGSDTIQDSAGTDTASFAGVSTTAATWTAVDTNTDGLLDALKINFGSDHVVTIRDYFNNTASTVSGSTAGSGLIESLSFSNNANVTFATAKGLVTGTSFGSVIDGTTGDDSLTGGSGNDILNADEGQDTLVGGTGNDTLNGQNGWDTYQFSNGWGQDTIEFDYSGGDRLDFSAVTTNLTIQLTPGLGDEVSDGLNTLNWGTSFIDIEYVEGGSGNDSITGNALDNEIHGGSGNNTLGGGLGNDTYLITDGNDLIQDFAGDDAIYLGGGSQYSVALFQTAGGDLQISDADTGSVTTIQDFANSTVGSVIAGNYTGLSHSEIDQVIQDLSAYATANNVSLSNLSDVQNNNDMMNIVASAFHY